jgi:hypothetical protein
MTAALARDIVEACRRVLPERRPLALHEPSLGFSGPQPQSRTPSQSSQSHMSPMVSPDPFKQSSDG